MMRRSFFFLAIILCFLLCACQREPVPTDASLPTTAAASQPTQAPTRPSPPWQVPEEDPLSYDAYFEKIRVYDTTMDYPTPEWREDFGDYSYYYTIQSDATGVYVADHTGQSRWHIGSTEEYAGCVWVAAEPRYVYGISGGTELFRMDYYGENRETLYIDESEVLGSLEHPVALVDQMLLFLAGAENEIGIYRLYLPTLDLELLYDGIALDEAPRLQEPYSNHEILWTASDPQWQKLYDELMADTSFIPSDLPTDIPGFTADYVRSYVKREYGINAAEAHYLNTLTGEHYTLDNERVRELGWRESYAVWKGTTWWDSFQALNKLGVTLPEGATPLCSLELDELSQQLFDPGEDRSNPGCLFLASYYDAPEDVDLFVLFCGGLGLDSQPTDEEWEYLEGLGLNRKYDHYRTTPEQIEQTLLTYTGLTLEETNKVGLEKMQYVEELDAYYTKSPGTYWSKYTLLGGYRTQTGELVLFYEDALQKPAKRGMVTLRSGENGSGYLFVSNQPFGE